MVNIRHKPRLAALLAGLVFAGLAFLSFTALASNSSVITIGSGQGIEQETVTIAVSMTNAVGMAAGTVDIKYNPDYVTPTGAAKGELLQDTNYFGFNPSLIDNPDVTRVSWTFEEFYEGPPNDGILFYLTFNLLAEGSSNLEIFYLDDFLGVTLADTHHEGTITVWGTQLPRVNQPWWDGNWIKWNDTGHPHQYRYLATLYKDGVVDPVTSEQVSAGVKQVNFSSAMDGAKPGRFTATVQALADPGTSFTHGQPSVLSGVNPVSVKLGAVGQPQWSTVPGEEWVITWNDLAEGAPDYGEGVGQYAVMIYRDGSPVGSASAGRGVERSLITPTDPGDYTIRIQAQPSDLQLYEYGELSPESGANFLAGPLPGFADPPAWSGDPSTLTRISWASIDHAVGYDLYLYKGAAAGSIDYNDPVVVIQGWAGTHYDFDIILDPGSGGGAGCYAVKVHARGDTVNYRDAENPSDPSAARCVGQLGQPGTVSLSNTGAASWSDDIADAAGYIVNLYKVAAGGDIMVDGVTLDDDVFAHSFLAVMRNTLLGGGLGEYYVEVIAIGTGLSINSVPKRSGTQEVQQLKQPGNVQISDTGILSWGNSDDNATRYWIQICRHDDFTFSPQPHNQSGQSILGTLRDWSIEGISNVFYAQVKAQALDTLFLDSDYSLSSNLVTLRPLADPYELEWDEAAKVLTWKHGEVNDTLRYEVKLYKTGVAEARVTKTVDPLDLAGGADFSANIDEAGYYYATVQAIADTGTFFFDSRAVQSGDLTQTGPLGRVDKPGFSSTGTVTWTDEGTALVYAVKLYDSSNTVVDSDTVDAGTGTYSFLAYMRGAGIEETYYATVTALGTGLPLFDDGPESIASDSRAVAVLNTPVVGLSSQGAATWSSANATHYDVGLYRGGVLVAASTLSNTTGTGRNYLDMMRQQEGVYTVRVIAKAPAGLYLDSAEGVSDPQTVTRLAQAAQPGFNLLGLATWTNVADATGYSVQLFKVGQQAPVSTKAASSGDVGVSFLDEILNAGCGTYTVRVTALGNDYLLLDGPQSEHSAGAVSRVLAQVEIPSWTALPSDISWLTVDGAVEYRVVLYGAGDPPIVHNTSATTHSFTLVQPEGLYYVTVQALGEGIVYDGPVSGYSDILVYSGGDAPYTASGEVHFLNGHFELSHDAPFVGLLQVSGYGQSGLGAVPGLAPAGIFLNIELGDGLEGVSLYMAVGYNPDELPEGMIEGSLRFYHYVDGSWILLESGVDTAGKFIWAEVDSFSTFGVFGEVRVAAADVDQTAVTSSRTLPKTAGRLSLLLLGFFLAGAGLLFYIRSRRLGKPVR